MTEANQQFDTFDQWVNKASSWLTRHPDYDDQPHVNFRAFCFDAHGRRCWIGSDFIRARDENAFPVRWIWPDQIGPALKDWTLSGEGPEPQPMCYVTFTSEFRGENSERLGPFWHVDVAGNSVDVKGNDGIEKIARIVTGSKSPVVFINAADGKVYDSFTITDEAG